MTAIFFAGFALWLLARVSKLLVGLCLLVLFWVFPMKALMVLLIFAVILEAGEGVDQLQDQMAMQIMTDQGSPLWEVVEEHITCHELVFVLSSSGQGVLVFAPKNGCSPDILALCQQYAERSPPQKTPDAPDAIDATDTAHRGGFFTPI
jgi:hypothetical protein